VSEVSIESILEAQPRTSSLVTLVGILLACGCWRPVAYDSAVFPHIFYGRNQCITSQVTAAVENRGRISHLMATVKIRVATGEMFESNFTSPS